MGRNDRHIRITDVARQAGVSVTTVSHVLSARRPVAQATRDRVLEVIDQLGYRPNELARSMRTQRTGTIALIIPDITNPFYPAMARGLQDVLAPAGYYGLVCNTDGDRPTERGTIQQMVTRRVDGIGFASFFRHPDDLSAAVSAGIPAVMLGGSTVAPGVDIVRSDDIGGGAQATRYLIERGYERIGFITGPAGGSPAAERVTGYHESLAARHRPVDPDLVVRAGFDREAGVQGMERLLDLPQPPRAVVCTNDVVAIGALDVAHQRHLAVPADIAIVGYDDIDAAALVSPPLTTVLNPARDIGQACGRLLLGRLSGDNGPPREVIVTTRLILRDSA